jgi:serine/threonine protein kinase
MASSEIFLMSQPPDSRSAPAATVRDTPDATRRDVLDATTRDDASLPYTLMQLPATLAARYRIVQPMPAAGGEADLLLVAAVADGQRYVIKIYRYGIVVKPEVLAKISAAAPEQVIRLVEYGQADGHGYEVLEYVPDGSLRQRLTAGPLAEGQIRALVRELSAALAVLHQHDILHRDIKPENVLIRQWEPLRMALTDFGIASVTEATQHFTTTARTLRYAAPEAATGRGDWNGGGLLVVGHGGAGGGERAASVRRAVGGGVELSVGDAAGGLQWGGGTVADAVPGVVAARSETALGSCGD